MNKAIKTYLIIIILSSVLTHFLFWGRPSETVFDEVHFGKFISGYFTRQYFFDIHPPLGKLLISGIGYFSGFKPGFSFAEIGQKFADKSYLWLRFLPMLAGTLLPAVIFFLVRRLGLSSLAAFSAGMLVVLENSILVQSRFFLLDAFLLLFGFSALLFYFIYETKSHDVKFLMPAGIFGALALSVKWTGGTFWAILIIIETFKTITNRWMVKSWLRYLLSRTLFLIIIPVIIYLSIFAIHLSILKKSGPGDAFMTPAFQKTLAGNSNTNDQKLKPINFFGKFAELNEEMYRANATLTASHPYSSKWYTWPFMKRPIYYWYGSTPLTNSGQASSPQVTTASRIYFLGNPVIWWTTTLAVIYLAVIASFLVFKAFKNRMVLVLWRSNNLPVFLVGAWLLNLLPFIGIKRAMFLYHYLPALIFSILTLVFLIDKLPNKKRIFSILLITSAAAFIFFAPLTYGLPLSEKAYHLRLWLQTWI